MERVAFLIEETGERIGCLLNPESFTMRRAAGLQPRWSVGGQLTGAGLSDDPLLVTGGGSTEIELDLLFDVSLAGSSIASDDVRDFTRPLWSLTENVAAEDGYRRPPVVRLVWGKSWNVPGLVSAVAERFEHFSRTGIPRRSWLRMRMVRMSEPEGPSDGPPVSPSVVLLPEGVEPGEESVLVHEVLGGGEEAEEGGGERLDEIAQRYYGNAAFWRLLAHYNNVADPMRIPPGTLIRVPPLSVVLESA